MNAKAEPARMARVSQTLRTSGASQDVRDVEDVRAGWQDGRAIAGCQVAAEKHKLEF